MSPTKKVEEDTTYNKPGFDGRLKYFDLMKEIIDAVTIYSMGKDYLNWHRSLRLMYSTTKPWLAKASDIKKKLDAAAEEVRHITSQNRVSGARIMDLDESLFEIQDAIIDGSKYLWLPGGTTQDDEDLDINKWMSESSI